MAKNEDDAGQSQEVNLTAERKGLPGDIKKPKRTLDDKDMALKEARDRVSILYKELEKKNEQLEKLEKVKSDFVSTVSHELRTPLSIIKEGIRIVLDGIPGKINDKQSDILKTSADNIDRLSKIINNLLDISKVEAGIVDLDRTLVDFSAVVKNICLHWQTEFDKRKQTLHITLPGSPIKIYIDPDKIIQVLHNLLSNAAKFTPGGGEIRVEVKDGQKDVEISVYNTGLGIAKEDLPKVFGKFHQFGRVNGPGERGTGLGLAISKELVELHHGTIRVASEVDKGTTFSFSLPKKDIELILKESIDNKIRIASERKMSLSLIVVYIPALDEFQKKLGFNGNHHFFDHIEKMAKDSLRRREDTLIRGSGEFVVVLFNAGKKDIAPVKNRIERAIDVYLSGCSELWLKKLNFTFGYATYPEDTTDSVELLKQARAVAHM